MRLSKTLTYSGFLVASLVMIAAFVTAKTYTQLVIAMVIYPIFVYWVYKIIIKDSITRTSLPPKGKISSIEVHMPQENSAKKVEKIQGEKVEVVADVDKRTFLKIVGAAGLSYFIFSLIGRRAESLLFGRSGELQTSSLSFPSEKQDTGLSSTQGYTISEIDDANTIAYYGFVNKDGAWFIMREDIEVNTFRYANGTSDFSNNWKNREHLRYDYYYNLF